MHHRPTNLAQLRDTGYTARPVKQEIRDNLITAMENGDTLFPGIVGYDDTVIPEVVNAILAGHDILFLGEKGQAKSRLMRLLVRFLDEVVPYLDLPGCPVHEDPLDPITTEGRRIIEERPPAEIPIAWWAREDRYAERLAPGTKFADVIGEIDPGKLAQGLSMSAESALHFGSLNSMILPDFNKPSVLSD